MISHKELVTNLAKPGGEIILTLSPSKAHLWHMMTGFVGEVFELRDAIRKQDKAHIVEECGDALFYIVGICIGTYLPVPSCRASAFPSEENLMIALDTHAEALLDLIKKYVIYNKPMEEAKLIEVLDSCVRVLYFIGKFHGISLKDMEDHNINKLMHRYTAGTYSDSDAQARKDKEAANLKELESLPASSVPTSTDEAEPGDSVDTTSELEEVGDDELEDIADNDEPGDEVNVGGV